MTEEIEKETSEEVTEVSETTDQAEGQVDPIEERSDLKWYVARALTGQENKVSKALKERVVNHGLSEFFSEVLIPEETVVTTSGGKKRTVKKKCFPGYILLKMVMNDTTWHLVTGTDKITGFIGGAPNKPLPISEEEAMAMTNRGQETQARPKTTINFVEGEEVKVIEGPFASFVGRVEAVSDKGKLKVNVSIFGRPTPVELEVTQVEKIS